MQDFRDPISNLLCVTFDNSSVRDRFYSSIQSLDEKLLSNIFKYYIDTQNKGNYFQSITNKSIVEDKDIYEIGDILRIKYNNKINSTYLLENKFYLYASDAFGLCARTEALMFMKEIPKSKCGFRLVFSLIKIFFSNKNKKIY